VIPYLKEVQAALPPGEFSFGQTVDMTQNLPATVFFQLGSGRKIS
jgi:hypothetical protein